MRRLGASGFQQTSRLARGFTLPSWRDALTFAFVAVTVAGSVAFLGLCVHRLSAVGKVEGLPDAFEPSCSTENQKRL
jgi:hypothetical protein